MYIEATINGKKLFFPRAAWQNETLVGYNDEETICIRFDAMHHEIRINTNKTIPARVDKEVSADTLPDTEEETWEE